MKWRGTTINGNPVTKWKEIYRYCVKLKDFVIEIRKYDEQAEISDQQIKYLHAVAIPALVEYTGNSKFMAEVELKRNCGAEWLIKRIDKNEIAILSKTTLTTKQTSEWLENIWDYMELIGCPIPPPDPEWKKSPDRQH